MSYTNYITEKTYNPDYTKAFDDYLRYGKRINAPYYIVKYHPSYGHYIWRTMMDNKVRPEHRENEGKVFEWHDPPPTNHPKLSPNCRCWSETIQAKCPEGMEDFVDRNDTKTWPKVPINGILVEGAPSKAKAKRFGNRSLYDQYGGEWKPHTSNKGHNLHWDYKAADRCSQWLNIPINNMPTNKPRDK